MVEPLPLCPSPSAQPLPLFLREELRDLSRPLPRPVIKHLILAGDGQHIKDLPPLQPSAHLTVVAVDLVTSHPPEGHSGLLRALDHPSPQRWLGGELYFRRNPSFGPPRMVISPGLRHIQLAI